MIRAALPKVSPGLGDVLRDAVAALSHCADLVGEAGCAPAMVYVSGAQGNLRRALAELVHRNAHLAPRAGDGFDVDTSGSSTVISVAGYPDTIQGCLLDSGGCVDVHALVQERQVERGVWMRRTGELGDVHVRGRVSRTSHGYFFVDEPEFEAGTHQPARSDLGRDIVASGLDLSRRPTFAAALEVSLATGSWVHLPTNSRWYADSATARAIVRLAAGCPGVDARLIARLGGCVDRDVLRFVETLAWRHWPTPPTAASPTT